MSKGLEALTYIKRDYTQFMTLYDKEQLDIIEKELKELEERREMMRRFNEACVPMVLDNETEKKLKALEIIKRLPEDYLQTLLSFIRDEWFKDEDFDGFISWGGDETPILINEEEYKLLREVLL